MKAGPVRSSATRDAARGPAQDAAIDVGLPRWWSVAGAVFWKEWTDALRDRRTLLVVLVSSVLLGPLALMALSTWVASLELKAERRHVVVEGLEHAPGLRNYLERQTLLPQPAPPGYEVLLRTGKLGEPVWVVPADFEADVLRGAAPVIEVVSDSSHRASQAGVGRALRLLQGYAQERAVLSLALRGVAPELVSPFQARERDLASAQGRAAQFTTMLPFFVIMAVLYGALNAALDTTAGERERGSLEPLLTTPAAQWPLVLGKWGAVAALSMSIAVLSCLSFIPAQWLLPSERLRSLFQFGWQEAGSFLVVLLPLAAALSALLMAVAMRCRSFKEAQANSTVVVLAASLLPLLALLNQEGDARWHLWVPALAQQALMTQVLKGEQPNAVDMLLPFGVCCALTAFGMWLVARVLRRAPA